MILRSSFSSEQTFENFHLCLACTSGAEGSYKFSKGSSIVILQTTFSSELTFEEMYICLESTSKKG